MQGTSTTHSSPATRLPFELVETDIVYLIYDACSFRACTLTYRRSSSPPYPYRFNQFRRHPDPYPARGEMCIAGTAHQKRRFGLLPWVKILWVCGDHTKHHILDAVSTSYSYSHSTH